MRPLTRRSPSAHTALGETASLIIEINQPEVEALLEDFMRKGRFATLEDTISYLVKSAPSLTAGPAPKTGTGAELVATLLRMPCKDVDIEPERFEMPISDPVTF